MIAAPATQMETPNNSCVFGSNHINRFAFARPDQVVTAYSPLGSGATVGDTTIAANPVLAAIGEK